MKRIVNGVTYNTDTSTLLAKFDYQQTDHNDTIVEEGTELLYQTRGGAFFLHEQTTRHEWNERERENVEKVTNTFRPMSRDQAHDWIMKGEREIFHNPFGDPPEAAEEEEPASTLYLRLPASLKRRVDQTAEDDKLSANSWAMRCLERCINMDSMDEIEETLGEIKYTTLAYTCCKGDGYSSSQLGEMLKYLDEQTDHLSKLLGFSDRKVIDLGTTAAQRRSAGTVWPEWKPAFEEA